MQVWWYGRGGSGVGGSSGWPVVRAAVVWALAAGAMMMVAVVVPVAAVAVAVAVTVVVAF